MISAGRLCKLESLSALFLTTLLLLITRIRGLRVAAIARLSPCVDHLHAAEPVALGESYPVKERAAAIQWLLSNLLGACLRLLLLGLLGLKVLLKVLILLGQLLLLLRDLDGHDLGHLFLLHVVFRWITV